MGARRSPVRDDASNAGPSLLREPGSGRSGGGKSRGGKQVATGEQRVRRGQGTVHETPIVPPRAQGLTAVRKAAKSWVNHFETGRCLFAAIVEDVEAYLKSATGYMYNGSLSQTVGTTVPPGLTYALQVEIGNRRDTLLCAVRHHRPGDRRHHGGRRRGRDGSRWWVDNAQSGVHVSLLVVPPVRTLIAGFRLPSKFLAPTLTHEPCATV